MHDVRGDQHSAAPPVGAGAVGGATRGHRRARLQRGAGARPEHRASARLPRRRVPVHVAHHHRRQRARTDGTWPVATALARDLPHVTACHLDRKGRGLALRYGLDALAMPPSSPTWTSTCRPTSTRCSRWSRHSCRVTPISRSDHGSPRDPRWPAAPRREFISRTYNLILRTVLATRFATRNAASRRCGPTSRDGCCPPSWTTAGSSTPSCCCSRSTTVCASTRCPVDWVDDADSRVHVVADRLRRPARHCAHGCAPSRPARGRSTSVRRLAPDLDDDFGRGS